MPESVARTAAPAPDEEVLRLADVDPRALDALLGRYGVALRQAADGEPITGSFWGASEAGIVGRTVHARRDTPVHSLLHELAHVVCMTAARRAGLDRDAGGDDAEECAVCYLQVILADSLGEVGRARLMRDMDAWGYSFRLGSTARWFDEDADDARRWLLARGLLTRDGTSTWRLRED